MWKKGKGREMTISETADVSWKSLMSSTPPVFTAYEELMCFYLFFAGNGSPAIHRSPLTESFIVLLSR